VAISLFILLEFDATSGTLLILNLKKGGEKCVELRLRSEYFLLFSVVAVSILMYIS
jgi:hypothetical protein